MKAASNPTSLAHLAPAAAYWRVMLRNVGAGVAIIQDVRHPDWPHHLRDAKSKALVYGRAYSAMKLSPGHALQPGAELLLFEVRMPQARRPAPAADLLQRPGRTLSQRNRLPAAGAPQYTPGTDETKDGTP